MTAEFGKFTASQIINFVPPITADELVGYARDTTDVLSGDFAVIPAPGEPFLLGEQSIYDSCDIVIDTNPPLGSDWEGMTVSQIVIRSTVWDADEETQYTPTYETARLQSEAVTSYSNYLVEVVNGEFPDHSD